MENKNSVFADYHEEVSYEFPPFRQHFTVLIERSLGFLLVLIFFVIQNTEFITEMIVSIRRGRIVIPAPTIAVGLILILIIALSVNRWYRTIYEVRDYTLIIERKTLNYMKNSIAVQNISNINIETSIYQAILGTCKVKLDTNSLSTANSTDVQIVLKKDKAEELKRALTVMIQEVNKKAVSEKDQAGQSESASGSESVRSSASGMEKEETILYQTKYRDSEIILNGIMNSSFPAFIGTFVVIITALQTFLSDTIGGIGVLLGAGMIAISVFVTLFWQIVKSWLADFNFTARREGDKIYVEKGLLTQNHYTVPIDKINAVVLETKMMGRIFGYASLRVINVGGEKEDVDGMKLLLADKEEELMRKMKLLLPEFDFPQMEDAESQPGRVLGKKFLTAVFPVFCLIIGIFAGIYSMASNVSAGVPDWLLIPVLVVFTVILLGVIFAYRVTKIAQTEKYLTISGGTFGKTVVSIPYDRIQYVKINQGPIERLFHVKRASLFILANSLRQVQNTGCFEDNTFDELIEKVRATYTRV